MTPNAEVALRAAKLSSQIGPLMTSAMMKKAKAPYYLHRLAQQLLEGGPCTFYRY